MSSILLAFTRACETLYHSSDEKQRKEADQWIVEFQKSKEAWGVVDMVLDQEQDESGGSTIVIERQFLAAKTFHTKLRLDYYDQIKVEERMQVKERLLQHLFRYARDRQKQAVTTQLCLAVASLVLQMEEWEGAIKDLASRLSGNNETMVALIELLQIIPEESASESYYVSDLRHGMLHVEMCDCCTDVLNYLHHCAQTNPMDQTLMMKILKCLRSWISEVEIPGEALSQSPLLRIVLSAIMEGSELFETASSVLQTIFYRYSEGHIPGHQVMMTVLIPEIFKLQPLFERAVQEEDEELAAGLTKIFTNLADAYAPSILYAENMEKGKLLELVLLGSSHPSYEVAAHTWDFWGRFLHDAVNLEDTDQRQEKKSQLVPYVQQVVVQAIRHAKLPEDHPNPMGISSIEGMENEFYFIRKDIREVLELSCDVLKAENILSLIHQRLTVVAEEFFRFTPEQQQCKWQEIEAFLFAVNWVSESCKVASSSSTSHVAVDYIIALCLNLPNISLLLRETTTKVLGSFAQFLRYSPQKLELAVNFVLDTLQRAPQIGSAAVGSLLHIVSHCKRLMMFAGNRLFEVIRNPGTDQIVMTDRLDVVECMAKIISAHDHDVAVQAMNHVSEPACQVLETIARGIVNRTTQSNEMPSPELVIYSLKTLELLWRYGWHSTRRSHENNDYHHREPTHPGFQVFQRLWESLCVITRTFCGQGKIVERLAALFKQCMRKFHESFQPYLEPFLSLVVESFQQSAMSPFIYVAGIAVEQFVGIGENRKKFVQMLGTISEKVFSVLNSFEAFTNNPDIVEDYFLTMDRALPMIPEIIRQPYFQRAFQYGANGILIEHKEANREVLLFLEDSIARGMPDRSKNLSNEEFVPVIRACFESSGQLLVNNLVAGVAGNISSNLLTSKGDDGSLSMTLYTACRYLYYSERDCEPGTTFRNVLRNALNTYSCKHVGQELGSHFVEDLVKAYERSGFDRFEDVLLDFNRKALPKLRRKLAAD